MKPHMQVTVSHAGCMQLVIELTYFSPVWTLKKSNDRFVNCLFVCKLWTDWDKIVIVRSRRDYLEMIKCWVSNSAEKGSVQRGEIFG